MAVRIGSEVTGMRKSDRFLLVPIGGVLLCAMLLCVMLVGACSAADKTTPASTETSDVTNLNVTALEIFTTDGAALYEGDSLDFDSLIVNSIDRYIVRVMIEEADCSEYVFENVVFGEEYELSVYREYDAVYLSLGNGSLYGGRPANETSLIDVTETVAPDV